MPNCCYAFKGQYKTYTVTTATMQLTLIIAFKSSDQITDGVL